MPMVRRPGRVGACAPAPTSERTLTTTDAFGAALLAWVGGETTPETIERDDGHVEEGAGPSGYLQPFDGWPRAERQSLRLLRGRVVDAGCGAGRVTSVLEQRGFEVVGIDASAKAVEAARRFGATDVRHMGVDQLTRAITGFDCVVLFGNNFGIFSTPERAHRLLAAWAARARPGTRIFAESTNAYAGGAPIMDRAYYRRNRALGRAVGTARFRFRFKALRGPMLSWLFVSQADLRRIVRGTGWTVPLVLSDGPMEPYVAVLERR